MESSRWMRYWRYVVASYYLLILFSVISMAMEDHKHSTHAPLQKALRKAGYKQMATILPGLDLATFHNIPLFAPTDRFLSLALASPGFAHLMHYHLSTLKLTLSDLTNMNARDRIPSLVPGQSIFITGLPNSSSPKRRWVSLNGYANVVSPDLYSDSNVIVHGIDRILDPYYHLLQPMIFSQRPPKRRKPKQKPIKKLPRGVQDHVELGRIDSGCRLNYSIQDSPLISSGLVEELHMLRGSNSVTPAYNASVKLSMHCPSLSSEVVGSIPAKSKSNGRTYASPLPNHSAAAVPIRSALPSDNDQNMDWVDLPNKLLGNHVVKDPADLHQLLTEGHFSDALLAHYMAKIQSH